MAIYYRAAVAFVHRFPMYHHASAQYGPNEFPTWYVNPPYLAAMLTPFAGHYEAFSRCWYLLIVGAFWLFAMTLARISGRVSVTSVMGWSLIIGLTPYAYYVMSVGNVDAILWPVFALAAIVERPVWCYTLMALIKPYAAWPLLVCATRQGVRTLRWPLLAAAVLTIVITACFGISQFVLWYKWVIPAVSQGTFDTINISLSVDILRLLRYVGLWHYSTGPLPVGPRLFLSTLGVLAPVISIFAARKWSFQWQCLASYFSAMLFSPLCWGTYMIMFLVPAALVYRTWSLRRSVTAAEIAN